MGFNSNDIKKAVKNGVENGLKKGHTKQAQSFLDRIGNLAETGSERFFEGVQGAQSGIQQLNNQISDYLPSDISVNDVINTIGYTPEDKTRSIAYEQQPSVFSTDENQNDKQQQYYAETTSEKQDEERDKNEKNRINQWVEEASDQYNIDKGLVESVIQQESNFDLDAQSSAGAYGPMQLMPGTADYLGVDRRDPRENIFGGTKYLRKMLDRFDGSLEKALAAYNAGPGAVEEYSGIPPFEETEDYVPSVLSNYSS